MQTINHKLLLIEDNPIDVELVRLILIDGNHLEFKMDVASCGEEALDRLRNTDQPKPDLILLDINMPGLNGFDVLQDIQHDPILKDIPVSMLSTSADPDDMSKAQQMGAKNYMTKPADVSQFERLVDMLDGLNFQDQANQRQLMKYAA